MIDELQHVVIDAAGDEKPISRRRPGDPQEGIGSGQYLAFHRHGTGHVIDEDVFLRLARDHLPVRPEIAVEAAGEDQQGLAVRGQGHGGGLAGGEARQIGQVGVQGLEQGAVGGGRGQQLAGGGDLRRGRGEGGAANREGRDARQEAAQTNKLLHKVKPRPLGRRSV